MKSYDNKVLFINDVIIFGGVSPCHHVIFWLISRDSRGAPTDLLGTTMEDTQTNGDLSIKYGLKMIMMMTTGQK